MKLEKHPLLDPKNWLNKTNKEAEVYKINCMLSFDITYSHKEIDDSKHDSLNQIASDIDVLAYLFSRYILQRDYFLKIPNIKKHLQDENCAKHILNFGCASVISSTILKIHPKFTKDLNIFKSIEHQTEEIVLAFSETLKKDNNLDKVLKEKEVSQYLLKVFPKNLEVSKRILKDWFPNEYIRPFFNEDAFDKKIVMKLLQKSNGYMHYSKLPEYLQEDEEICQAVLKSNPHTVVKVSGIKNFNDWLTLISDGDQPFNYELYSMIESATKNKAVLQKDKDILRLFKLIVEQQSTCYVDLMGGPVFSSHPTQKFIMDLSKKSKLIKEFIQTDFGKNFINYPISSYSEFSRFETEELPQIYEVLKTCYLKLNLEKSLPKNKGKNNKVINKTINKI